MARTVAYHGYALRLLYAQRLDQTHPAQEFFDGLPPKIQKKFAVSFKKIGDTGKLFNKEHFKIIEDTRFFEFKVHRHRIICRFLEDKVLLLTNGCEEERGTSRKGEPHQMSNMKNSVEQLLDTEQGRREFAQEELAFDATELVSELMEIEGVNKVELAKRMGKSKAYVTQVLSGSRNLTLHTLAELTFTLGYAVTLKAEPISESNCGYRIIDISARKGQTVVTGEAVVKTASLHLASLSDFPQTFPASLAA